MKTIGSSTKNHNKLTEGVKHMRHRIVSGTGLGNPSPEILDNNGVLYGPFVKFAMKFYFPDGFDFKIKDDEILIGFEPAYQYERLKIISINKDKDKSYIQNGKAWGGYGSQITKATRYYKDYKNKCKFTRFVDLWHNVLFSGNHK